MQAEVPPHAGDDQRWTNLPDGGRICDEGFRCYRNEALAAAKERSARGPNNRDGGGGGFMNVTGESIQASRNTADVGIVGAERLVASSEVAFHHYPIPDLTPASSVEALSELVFHLAAILAPGKVRACYFFHDGFFGANRLTDLRPNG